MFTVFKKSVLFLSVLAFATNAFGSNATLPVKSSIWSSVSTFASSHPWWTAYLAFGALVGGTLGVTSYFNNHDLEECKSLSASLSAGATPKKIACSLYSNNVWCKDLRAAIAKYNEQSGFINLADVQTKLAEAIRELSPRKENTNSFKKDVFTPYLILGALGAGISWFWKK